MEVWSFPFALKVIMTNLTCAQPVWLFGALSSLQVNPNHLSIQSRNAAGNPNTSRVVGPRNDTILNYNSMHIILHNLHLHEESVVYYQSL